MFFQFGQEGIGGVARGVFVIHQGHHLVVEEKAQVVHIGAANPQQIVVHHKLFGVHHGSQPFVDTDAGLQEVFVHRLSHSLHYFYVVVARHYPANVYPAEGRVLQGLQGGGRRRGVGVIEPEVLFGAVQGPFEAVPQGEHLVVRRVRNNLHGYVRKLRHFRQVVHPGRFLQVFFHIEGAQLGSHAVLVFFIDGGEVGHGGAGDTDIGIPPVKEILVLDVAAAHVADLAVYEQDLPVVPMGCQVGPHIVQQHNGPMEKIQLYSIFFQGGQLFQMLFFVGGFVQDDADVHPAPGLFPQDVFNYGSGRICAETVVVYVDGLFGIFKVFLEDVPFLSAVRKQGYGIALRGLQSGVLFHQGRQLLVCQPDAGILRGILYLGDIGLVQRGAVAAACQKQGSGQKESSLYCHRMG